MPLIMASRSASLQCNCIRRLIYAISRRLALIIALVTSIMVTFAS